MSNDASDTNFEVEIPEAEYVFAEALQASISISPGLEPLKIIRRQAPTPRRAVVLEPWSDVEADAAIEARNQRQMEARQEENQEIARQRDVATQERQEENLRQFGSSAVPEANNVAESAAAVVKERLGREALASIQAAQVFELPRYSGLAFKSDKRLKQNVTVPFAAAMKVVEGRVARNEPVTEKDIASALDSISSQIETYEASLASPKYAIDPKKGKSPNPKEAAHCQAKLNLAVKMRADLLEAQRAGNHVLEAAREAARQQLADDGTISGMEELIGEGHREDFLAVRNQISKLGPDSLQAFFECRPDPKFIALLMKESKLKTAEMEAMANVICGAEEEAGADYGVQLIEEMVKLELSGGYDKGSAFRSTMLVTKLQSKLTETGSIGREFRENILGDQLAALGEIGKIQLDPKRTPSRGESSEDQTFVRESIDKVTAFVDDLMTSVTGSALPDNLRDVCKVMWDNTGDFQQVGGFLFLRFINPFLIKSPSKHTAIAITKVLQNISNLVLFGTKEQHMKPLNGVVQKWIPRWKAYVMETITDFPPLSELFQKRLTALQPRVTAAAGTPEGENAKLKVSEANVFARKADFVQANALLDQAEQALITDKFIKDKVKEVYNNSGDISIFNDILGTSTPDQPLAGVDPKVIERIAQLSYCNLDLVLKVKSLRESFDAHLKKEFSTENADFPIKAVAAKAISNVDEQNAEIDSIIAEFVIDSAARQVNLMSKNSDPVLAAAGLTPDPNRYQSTVFKDAWDGCIGEIRDLLATDTMVRWKATIDKAYYVQEVVDYLTTKLSRSAEPTETLSLDD